MSCYPAAAPARELRIDPSAACFLKRGSPVLLLYGLGRSHRCSGDDYARFGEHHRAVARDRLGFRSPPKPAGGYTAGADVDALVAVLDWFGIDEPVLVGAHSVGSLVALARPDTAASEVRALQVAAPT